MQVMPAYTACRRCTFEFPSTVRQCPMCSLPVSPMPSPAGLTEVPDNQNAQGMGATPSETAEPWQCPRCTFLNMDGGITCTVCSTYRPPKPPSPEEVEKCARNFEHILNVIELAKKMCSFGIETEQTDLAIDERQNLLKSSNENVDRFRERRRAICKQQRGISHLAFEGGEEAETSIKVMTHN